VPYHGVHESAERLGVGGSLTNPVVDSIQPFGNTRREKSVYVYIHFFFQDFLLRHLGSRREDQASGLGRRAMPTTPQITPKYVEVRHIPIITRIDITARKWLVVIFLLLFILADLFMLVAALFGSGEIHSFIPLLGGRI
jgi:hypothetical protein